MNIQGMIGFIVDSLQGSNVRIQIQIDNRCYVQESGDCSELSKNPIYYYLNNKKVVSSSFIKWMSEQIEKANLSEGTKGNHRNALAQLICFRGDISFAGLNKKLIREFNEFLLKKGYAKNTIVKFMKIFHKYVNIAIADDYITQDPFAGYRNKYEHTHKNFLTENEICQLFHIVNSLKRPYERESIRAFLFSCYTGVRYSDIRRITSKNISTINGVTWLIFKSQKTDHETHIPLSELSGGAALCLLDKSKPEDEKQFDVPINGVCNHNLQRVLKRMGITRHISFHCGRVSAAHNLIKNGAPIHTVQQILGHASVITTEGYIKLSDDVLLSSLRTH